MSFTLLVYKIPCQLKHPNIIQLKTYFHELDYVYLIMEYAAGGELFDKIGNQSAGSI
jgi:serine/threonine protein kinase